MISACFIVKNEEKWLEGCLQNIQPLVSEIIIVDTGSTDRSKEIATKFGAKIFDFTWIDDFAAARNFCIQKATQPWILNFDPDERIAQKDLERINALTWRTDVDGFSFVIRNYTSNASQTFFYPCQGEFPEFEKDQIGYFETRRIKLFQNFRGIEFRGAVHELVESTVKGKVETPGIAIHHFGELPAEKARKGKHSLYFPILQKKVAADPQNWKAQYELGCEYVGVEQFQEAIGHFEKSLLAKDYEQTYSHLGHCYFVCGRTSDAEKIYKRGLELYPREHDIAFNYASMKIDQAKWNEALEILKPATEAHPKSFALLRVYAYCLMNLERIDEARTYLERAIALFPKYEDALVDMAIVRYFQGQPDQAKKHVEQVLQFNPESARAHGFLKAMAAQA